jgi:hypothetical protein
MNVRRIISFGFFLWMIASLSFANGKELIGRVERVRIYPGNLLVQARIDTGADLSSLDCDCINFFKRNGEDWVRFVVYTVDGRPTFMEQKVVQERIVLRLGVCLGSIYKETEVNLADRSSLTYPMLIGRDFLEGNFLVDPSLRYKTKPRCKVPKR